MVELTLHWLPDESHVVRLVRARQESADHEIFLGAGHHLLCDPEAQYFAEKLDAAVEIVPVQ